MLGLRQVSSSGFVACGLAQPDFARVWALTSPDDLMVLEEETPPEPAARIGHQLLAAGVVTVNGLAEALAYQPKVPGRRLGWILVMLGHLEQEDLDRVLAARMGVPCVTLRKFRPRSDCARRIPVGTARRLGIVLVHEDARCAWVAFANATDRGARDAASFLLGKRVVALQVGKREIDAYLRERDPGSNAPNNPYYDARPQRGEGGARATPADGLDFVEFRAA